MISKKMEDALNKQINAELFSWYLYQSMAACFEASNMRGMAQWMNLQAKEEMGHAMKIYGFIVERGGRIKLTEIAAPKQKWDSPLAAFEEAYGHEQKVTGLINGLVAAARTEKDYASEIFLQWFVSEQVEEEANASAIVEKLRLAGGHTGALFMIDRELGMRGKS